jgi:hypothetical protein
MFVTPGLAWFLITVKFGAGFVVGVFVTLLFYRTRLTTGLLLRGALFGGCAYLIASGTAGWLSFDPRWGKNAWIRDCVAEYEAAICIASSCIAALLAGIRLRSHANLRAPAP